MESAICCLALQERFTPVSANITELDPECADLAMVEEAVACGVGHIMLDNMDLATVGRAVRLVAGRARLEASGGVTLESAQALAATGVDFVSVGALTHSAPALDLSLKVRP